jgi:LmbE family N-acetylglucosaminyl deacetylase
MSRMDRRGFLGGSFSAPLLAQMQAQAADIAVERPVPGKPHASKVLAAIQPHSDDLPLFAAGTIAKLINEGYTGVLIRMTNDDMAGPGTVGDTVLANEKDNTAVARLLGLGRVVDLNYSNHQMDNESRIEIRSRLIFLFRLLKIDTIFCYDPWGHYEENPDHYVTAQCVESACWMAAGSKDYPEHFAAGLQPHAVSEKYYFARGPQLVTRVVDISAMMDKKVEVNLANVAQGPAGVNGSKLRARLAAGRQRLPLLGNDDDTANRQYIKHLVLKRDAEWGKKYGVEFAEPYHYIGPEPDHVSEYVRQNAVGV